MLAHLLLACSSQIHCVSSFLASLPGITGLLCFCFALYSFQGAPRCPFAPLVSRDSFCIIASTLRDVNHFFRLFQKKLRVNPRSQTLTQLRRRSCLPVHTCAAGIACRHTVDGVARQRRYRNCMPIIIYIGKNARTLFYPSASESRSRLPCRRQLTASDSSGKNRPTRPDSFPCRSCRRRPGSQRQACSSTSW